MTRYRTFKRTAKNFEQFSSARKLHDQSNMTVEEARRRCEQWNGERTPAQIKAGTKLEFEQQQ